MKILALEPYYSGSHRAFLDGWIDHSSYDWELLTLPGYKWKWRMRHAAIHFANEVNRLWASGQKWDVLFCSDMLNLAEFYGLSAPYIKSIPSVIYFHENQLTYPHRFYQERDMQFALTNFTSCLAANSVWFNSEYHRTSFLEQMRSFLKRMPDFQPLEQHESLQRKSSVIYPGITAVDKPSTRKDGPLRILWVARWEHDKNPEDFFRAIELLKNQTDRFRISIIGEQFDQSPDCFAKAQQELHDHIDRFGFQPSREDYLSALTEADVVISTAYHEFFGLSIIEAVAAGAMPLLPHRLSYPELFNEHQWEGCFYDGSPEQLADKLFRLVEEIEHNGELKTYSNKQGYRHVSRFFWPMTVARADMELDRVVKASQIADAKDKA